MAKTSDEIRPLPRGLGTSLIDSINQQLRDLDPKTATAIVQVNKEGANLAVMLRVDQRWSFAGWLEHRKDEGLSGGAKVVLEWE